MVGGLFIREEVNARLLRECIMKKKRKKFSASKEARRRARLSAGSPPPARVIPDKRLEAAET